MRNEELRYVENALAVTSRRIIELLFKLDDLKENYKALVKKQEELVSERSKDLHRLQETYNIEDILGGGKREVR